MPDPSESSKVDRSQLAGKTILITGGASGFGAAFAREWASHGANIIIGDMNNTAGEKLVAELRSSTGSQHHHYQRCDVTNWMSQVRLFQMAVKASPMGHIDAVVPNAGISADSNSPTGDFENPEGLDKDDPPAPRFKILDVNLTGVMYTVHLAMHWLARRNGDDNDKPTSEGAPSTSRDRHILLIGSIASLTPLVGAAQYTASKHAVTGLFRSLRGTAFRRGIRINMLCPHFVKTGLLSEGVMLILAGGGLGELSDVVEAGTDFMADRTAYGRSVVIGPKLKVEDGDDGEMRLVEIPQEEGEGKGVWDCYAHDYQSTEAFFYRYTRLLIAFAKMRGWAGWAKDVFNVVFRRK